MIWLDCAWYECEHIQAAEQIHEDECTGKCVCMCVLELDSQCLPQSLSTLSSEIGSPTEHTTIPFRETDWPESPSDVFISLHKH